MARREWTEEEEKYLCENYPSEDLKVMSKILGRSIGTIRASAQRRGIKRKTYANGKGKNAPLDIHLCWYCKHSLDIPQGYCSWAHNLIPVDGWKAEMKKNGKFKLIECPFFEKE